MKKTLEDEWYVAIKAYKFEIFEFFSCIIIYCISVQSLHNLESTDSVIQA